MGYYTGSGVRSGGSSTVAPFQTYLWNGFHTVYQKTVSSSTRKSGVSQATAASAGSECNLQSHQFTIGSSWYNAFNCKGTKNHATYSQIGDSNLYELVTTSETLYAKMDNQDWVGPS